ncbi:hypothetical protein [Aquiflexum gelatinilyticum]|uniref:Uncharacterized protein n=1 Tax=Aquiflexum gelatinilyticum TaxID=2961943 RepID=A0A9X2P637_9BACT|nr:hypothetical protein [Aquiflexum gelatinilyticum]MCR9016072.1 hypothetical protein [Aquiflexum gelatinilyticum]
MRNILLIILSLVTINSFGQQWIEFQVDPSLTITIPENYELTDTLGQKGVIAQIDNGLILLTVMQNKGKTKLNIQNENDLIEAYKGIQRGVTRSQNGQLIKEEILDKEALKILRFSISAIMENERQIRHFLIVFLNDNIYMLNFWELESMSNEMSEIREKLFSSIKFPSTATMEDQKSQVVQGSTSYNISYLIGQIIGYLLILGLIVLFIMYFVKRLKRKKIRDTMQT